MNLNDIIGKRVVSTFCEFGSPMGTVIWAAQMTFDDGSVLDIDVKGRIGDAWLEFEYTEGAELSAEAKAELDGLS